MGDLVYLSAPVYNPAQDAAEEKMYDILTGAGFEVFRAARNGMDENPEERVQAIHRAHVLVFNLDGLLPPGASIHAIVNPQNKVEIPFTQDVQQIIDAGWAATGRGCGPRAKDRKVILLPGEVEQQANSPKGMAVGLPPGVILCQVASGPMNITDPNALVEIGIGSTLNKPMVVLAVGDVQCGAHVQSNVLLTESFEEFEGVVKTLSSCDGYAAAVDSCIAEKLRSEDGGEEEVEEADESEG